MKSFELHQIIDLKSRRVALEALVPKTWLEHPVLPTLATADPSVVVTVTKDEDFVLPGIRGLIQRLAQRLSAPKTRTGDTMSALTPMLEGQRHRQIRAWLASSLSEGLRAIEHSLPRTAERLMAQISHRRYAEPVSLHLAALVRDVFSKLAGRELTVPCSAPAAMPATDLQSECNHSFNFIRTLKVSILP